MSPKIKKDSKRPKTLVADKIDSVRNLGLDNHIVFSFIHMSKDQGSTFEQWNNEGKLLPALERLREYSGKKISQQDSIFTIYGDFPPKTMFRHPKYIPQDAQWARIHVDGKHVIAGHVVRNIFYVVFLDSDHSFWVTEKKHT